MEISMSNTVCRIDDNVVTSKLVDEVVMMDLTTGDYYGLNSIASTIWNAIERPIKIASLIETLSDEFEVEWDICKKDVFAFLNQLIENDLAKIDSE